VSLVLCVPTMAQVSEGAIETTHCSLAYSALACFRWGCYVRSVPSGPQLSCAAMRSRFWPCLNY
jgi:hypothetical protein